MINVAAGFVLAFAFVIACAVLAFAVMVIIAYKRTTCDCKHQAGCPLAGTRMK